MKNKTISVVSMIKGGTGKTTISVNLTAALQRDNQKVCLVDLDDEQAASYKWGIKRNIHAVLSPQVEKLAAVVREHDITIFDTGGYDTSSTQALISVSDIILIPVSMSAIETESFLQLIKKVTKIKEILKRDDLNIFIVPNRIHTSITSTKVLKHFRPLKALGYKVAPTLYNRVSFQNSYSNGGSVFELNDKKSQTEIFNLKEFILKY